MFVANVKKVSKKLKTDKAVKCETPVKFLTSHLITNCIHELFMSGKFQDSLEEANKVPVYKSKYPFNKSNYKPLSILPFLFKIYERLIFKRLPNHAKSTLSQILYSFRKGHSTHPAQICTVAAKRIR